MPDIVKALSKFAKDKEMLNKGALCVALVVTKHARENGLPLDPDTLLTEGGGQVLGLGKSAVQSILEKYDIHRVLAEEGGRTSRGSIGNMRNYVAFLNRIHKTTAINFDEIERWWIDKVRAHFLGKPLVLRFDPSKSIQGIIHDLIDQAQKKQKAAAGSTFAGTVLQHLVGAKLAILLGPDIKHHGASVADESSGREADFKVDDVAIHVTMAPSEALIRKCENNIETGLKPLIITAHKSYLGALSLVGQSPMGDRIDVFDAEQFLAGNLYEFSGFEKAKRRESARQLIMKYNEIVDKHETDPCLRIDVRK